jgi:hypothetical protein
MTNGLAGKGFDSAKKFSLPDHLRLFRDTLRRYLHRSSFGHPGSIIPGKVRVLAFYLPQFHPIPENDAWWGDGFTEWTNVKKGRPLFRNHHQPNLPADLGYYDLRNTVVRNAQAELAREAGIEGFVYWHYWFGNGRQLLERPFREVLDSGSPDFPFCLAWANESWTGKWHGLEDKILIGQEYPGMDDYTAHFNSLKNAFSDHRYIRVNGRILFLIYKPWKIPDQKAFTDCWRKLALEEGISDFYFIGVSDTPIPPESGFDGIISGAPDLPEKTIFPTFAEQLFHRIFSLNLRNWLRVLNRVGPEVYPYASFVHHTFNLPLPANEFPVVIPNWDNTPRVGRNGIVLHGSSPELFSMLMQKSIGRVADKPDGEKLIFIKSWNEWAEGNYLEPDRQWGKEYLDALRNVLSRFN